MNIGIITNFSSQNTVNTVLYDEAMGGGYVSLINVIRYIR